INGKHYQTIWLKEGDEKVVQVFDQRFFPHKIEVFDITNTDEAAFVIKEMVVRGAPLIGVTAAYGMYLGYLEAKTQKNPEEYLLQVANKLNATRPTAVNLAWAINEMQSALKNVTDLDEKIVVALKRAHEIKQE